MTEILTEWLRLRPFEKTDAASYAAIRYHPDVDSWLMPAPTDDPVSPLGALIAEYNRDRRTFDDHFAMTFST